MIDLLDFWGKAQPVDPDRGPDWHPLAFHSFDVAAVGDVLLTSDRGLRDRICSLMGVDAHIAVPLVCYLLAIHDIGKFAKKFQAKSPRHFPACFGADPAAVATSYDHGNGGLRLFDACEPAFRLPQGPGSRAWRPLIAAVTGHHGAPPVGDRGAGVERLRGDFGRQGIDAACGFLEQAHVLLDVPPDMPIPSAQHSRRASFAVAGLAVLADWVGSSQDWFPYREPKQDLRDYWSSARRCALTAIAKAGILPAESNSHIGYDALIRADGATSHPRPRPMQQWAGNVELPDGPALFLIEDETGSGKTEAALMLAHRLMTDGRADGLYVALPTMATANAMFERLGEVHRRLFADRAQPSIALAHAARGMHEGFRDAVLRGGRREASYSRGLDGEKESETTASAACATWIADDRRRSFLADVGAGTVDQALLSILPTRHQSLRLLGLMRRVLVLDEVHAYDAYMQREIERLIEFQAGLGGSVVLLSATLPESIRLKLVAAFNKGSGTKVPASAASSDYPLATVCAANGDVSTAIAAIPDRARRIPVRFLRSVDEACEQVAEAARSGDSVLYLRNTVDDALDAYRELTTRDLDTQLFHARFALTDRLEIERQVLARFGKSSTPEQRRGKVLVATQVVEQSLDLDFDAMVTDLAPMDLVIQRAGRLWRHDRARGRSDPELLVVGPEPVNDASDTWFSEFFPRAAFVYENHALLWLTAKVLEEKGMIESPAGLRTLIEAVYGDDAPENMPEGLETRFWDADGKSRAEGSIATQNTLDFAKGYIRDSGAWDVDHRTPTRIGDQEQVTLRLARVIDGRVEPYAQGVPSSERWRAWRLSEVNVAARRVRGEAMVPEHAQAARAAKAEWTRYEDDRILVVLEQDPSGDAKHWIGKAWAQGSESGVVSVRYHLDRGLEIVTDGPSNGNVPASVAG